MIIKGDVNGDGRITQLDLSLMKGHILGKFTPDNNALIAADVNNDGKVNITDLAALKKHLLGLKIINEVVG